MTDEELVAEYLKAGGDYDFVVLSPSTHPELIFPKDVVKTVVARKHYEALKESRSND